MKQLLIFLVAVSFHGRAHTQITFSTVKGKKANYSLSIPPGYQSKESIGANVDIKYVDGEGASIITVVRTLSSNVTNQDIRQMAQLSDADFKDQLESNGMENITVVKRGITEINGVTTYYAYYRDDRLYFHTITQSRFGKIINLTYTCEYARKDQYMPYIFRVVNSFKS
jgi:hypothetical protein